MVKINKKQIKVYLDNLSDAILIGDRNKAVSILALLKSKYNLMEAL